MDLSVFKRLNKRFFKCRVQIKRSKSLPPIHDISKTMEAAGKALFWAISSRVIQFESIPPWLKKHPRGLMDMLDGSGEPVEVEVHTWDLYWLFAVDWLVTNHWESGVVFSAGVVTKKMRDHPERYLGEYFFRDFLHIKCRILPKYQKTSLCDVAKTSEDACLYLASKPVRENKGGRRGPEKKYTFEQLKQVRASYEIHYKEMGESKAAWNKAAEDHNIKTGKAAEMACRRYLKKNK